jgi:PAS domain-containing protein
MFLLVAHLDSISLCVWYRVLAQALPPCTIVHANRAFSEFSGLTNEQLQGHTLGSILIAVQHDAQQQVHFVDAFLKGVNDSRTCRMRTLSVRDAPKTSHSRITHWLVQVESPERHGIAPMMNHSAIA